MDDYPHEDIESLRNVLRRNGFVRCDIAACNCGSWHARYGLRERMNEIKDALSEAGHPLSNENGHLVSVALAALIAERDALRDLVASANKSIGGSHTIAWQQKAHALAI